LGIENKLPNVLTTKLDMLVNWGRRNSLFLYTFATACCGIEIMSTFTARYDIARFGAEVIRFSPRQADLMIIAGRIVLKQTPVLMKIWRQMAEPKWIIAMGACACTGGVFRTYAVVQGVDQFLPVDVYVPGCPPRPEALLDGIMELQRKITEEKIADRVHGD